ncbi:MAG: hypothetical protein RL701_2222 [Pseudomonadota bacterium]|jgi:hypothetical protein
MDWKQLMRMTDGEAFVVERVRLPTTGVAIEGSFDLPPLARLDVDDQVFIAAFVKSHGSIKEMERLFGVSYPTIKNRLNKLGAALDPELTVAAAQDEVPSERDDRRTILDRLERGEISAKVAAEALKR